MDEVVCHENIEKAIKCVENNKGAAGIDKMQVAELKHYMDQNRERIKLMLLNGTYKPNPVRRVEIPKSDGGKRQLGIPTVVDRVVQQAISLILTPIFDPLFSENSYGFRIKRSAIQAVEKAKGYVEDGYGIVVDMDLEKFFDTVNHDILMNRIERIIHDKMMLQIIRKYLRAGVLLNGTCVTTEQGTPQGGPLSPLLSNIILDDLDKELEKRGHKAVRYADDCNIYVKTRRAGKRVYDSIKKFIENRLKLKVNEQKSAVDKTFKRKFLSFRIFAFAKEIKIGIASQAIDRMKEKIRRLTKRNAGISMEERIKQLNSYLKGWFNYFRLSDNKSTFYELDAWIRRRLRACRLKEWKRCKTKLRMLKSLGIKDSSARNISGSRKKFWRLSMAPQVHRALGNSYWKNLGLFSMHERYKEICKSL